MKFRNMDNKTEFEVEETFWKNQESNKNIESFATLRDLRVALRKRYFPLDEFADLL